MFNFTKTKTTLEFKRNGLGLLLDSAPVTNV